MSRVRDVDVREYLASARSGDHRGATRLVLDLVHDGVPADAVIEGVLVTAQRETGFRWHRDEWTIADEHVVTSTTAAVIEALTTTMDHRHDGRHLVVVCAEGDWHALPARLFAERMRIRGWSVSFLGGSTPADDVASFLARRRPDALTVTCSLSVHFAGAARLADVAHEQGVPVLIGGTALAGNPRRALVLGADDVAASAEDAHAALGRLAGAPVRRRTTALDRGALALDGAAPEHAHAALAGLARTLPAVSRLDHRELVRTHLSLSAVVRVTAAALLVGDEAVWTDHADWQRSMLAVRGVPDPVFLVAVQAVADQLAVDAPDAARLIDAYVAASS